MTEHVQGDPCQPFNILTATIALSHPWACQVEACVVVMGEPSRPYVVVPHLHDQCLDVESTSMALTMDTLVSHINNAAHQPHDDIVITSKNAKDLLQSLKAQGIIPGRTARARLTTIDTLQHALLACGKPSHAVAKLVGALQGLIPRPTPGMPGIPNIEARDDNIPQGSSASGERAKPTPAMLVRLPACMAHACVGTASALHHADITLALH